MSKWYDVNREDISLSVNRDEVCINFDSDESGNIWISAKVKDIREVLAEIDGGDK